MKQHADQDSNNSNPEYKSTGAAMLQSIQFTEASRLASKGTNHIVGVSSMDHLPNLYFSEGATALQVNADPVVTLASLIALHSKDNNPNTDLSAPIDRHRPNAVQNLFFWVQSDVCLAPIRSDPKKQVLVQISIASGENLAGTTAAPSNLGVGLGDNL